MREKIVAAASDAMIVIADDTKLKDHLGAFALPVEVNKFAHDATAGALQDVFAQYGLSGSVALRGAKHLLKPMAVILFMTAPWGKLMRRMNWHLHCWPCRAWLNTGCF